MQAPPNVSCWGCEGPHFQQDCPKGQTRSRQKEGKTAMVNSGNTHRIHAVVHNHQEEHWSIVMESIKDWPIPKNVHEVHSFMGLAWYYRIFVEGFSKIVKPITTLQRKGIRYKWTSECVFSFAELKYC